MHVSHGSFVAVVGPEIEALGNAAHMVVEAQPTVVRRHDREVEAALASHEAVLEAAVVGVEDGEKLVKPKAYVVLKQAGDASDELTKALQQHVKGRLAPYKYPRWIEFVPELPKTATGKIQRFKLRPHPGA